MRIEEQLKLEIEQIDKEITLAELDFQNEIESNPKLIKLKKLIQELGEQRKILDNAYDLMQSRIMSNRDIINFDIYERVSIYAPSPNIEKIIHQNISTCLDWKKDEENYRITGSLKLELYYSTFNSNEYARYSHTIPVEIKIPFNRIVDEELAKVEVNDLNVEIVGKRCVNVTGTLSIRL